MTRRHHFLQAYFVAHVVDGLLEKLEALAARRAGLHGAGEVELLQQLLQLFLQGQMLAVGGNQQPVHCGRNQG